MKNKRKQKTYWPESQFTFRNIVAWIISLVLTLAALYYFSGIKSFI
ncbi:MAG TPA: hypothetical protein VGD65_10680 [Chryseosolibacter sp.]